jgi:hypothetical protein
MARKSNTYFEQVPLEAVMKIVDPTGAMRSKEAPRVGCASFAIRSARFRARVPLQDRQRQASELGTRAAPGRRPA